MSSGLGWRNRLTGYGGIKGKRLEASHFFLSGFLHAAVKYVLPSIELKELNAPKHLICLLQSLVGVLLQQLHTHLPEEYNKNTASLSIRMAQKL